MKIIWQKSDEMTFVLELDERFGQILDLKRGLLWWPTPLSSIESQGGPWYDYTGPQERLAELLAKVKPAPPIELPAVRRRTDEEFKQLMKELEAEIEAEEHSKE